MIINTVIRQYRNILLKYPNLYDKVEFSWKVEEISETQSKIAYIEMLGEFGIYIDESSYILEQYIDQYIAASSSQLLQ